jgi:hypothetical protein
LSNAHPKTLLIVPTLRLLNNSIVVDVAHSTTTTELNKVVQSEKSLNSKKITYFESKIDFKSYELTV